MADPLMPAASAMNESEVSDATLAELQGTIHQVVTQCLDSVDMKREALEEAYTRLVGAAITAHNNTAASCFAPYDQTWLETHCDLYRALMVTSLLLRLQHAQDYEASKLCCLEESVERCFALLHILVAVTEGDESLADSIPVSHYSLFNTLLQEPLVPLLKSERQQFWLSNGADEDDDYHSDDGGTDANQLELPDKKQLILEEKELLLMAQRPIPAVRFSPEVIIQEPAPPKRPNDILMRHGHVQLFRCGVLFLYGDQGERIVFSSTTTIEEDLTSTNGLCIQITDDSATPVNSIQLTIADPKNRNAWRNALDVSLQHARIRNELRLEAVELWDGR